MMPPAALRIGQPRRISRRASGVVLQLVALSSALGVFRAGAETKAGFSRLASAPPGARRPSLGNSRSRARAILPALRCPESPDRSPLPDLPVWTSGERASTKVVDTQPRRGATRVASFSAHRLSTILRCLVPIDAPFKIELCVRSNPTQRDAAAALEFSW